MLIAFCSMMLVKDYHHHDHDHASCVPSGEAAFTETDDCPICHFTLVPQQAKITQVVISAPQTFVLLRSIFILSYTSTDTQAPLSRGPPAC